MEGGGKPHPDGQPRIWDYVTLSGKRDSAGEIQVKTPDMVKLPQILGGAQLNHIGP